MRRAEWIVLAAIGVAAACGTKGDDESTQSAPVEAEPCRSGEDACGSYVCDLPPDTPHGAGDGGAPSAAADGGAITGPDGHVVDDPSRPTKPTFVSLTFDDTFEDQFQLLDIFRAADVHATFYVNSARLGERTYMTAEQLRTLEAAGHEIAGHTVTHPTLPAVDADEQKRQICNDRVALLAVGLKVTSFAYPHGAFTPETQQIVRDCGYNSARVVGGLGCVGCPGGEPATPATLGELDVMAIRSPTSVKCNTSLQTMKDQVLLAEQTTGGWVPMVFHHVCDNCGRNAVAPAMLRDFVTWLGARKGRGTVAKTMQEMVGGDVKPGVNGPPPAPPRARTGNLVENPGFEDPDPNSEDLARCWVKGGEGSNKFDFGRTKDAHSGSWAQWLEVKSYTDGARRIYSRQDLGYCAPVIEPGKRYRVSAWYKSTVGPRFTVYYREPSGFWKYWMTSPPLPASADWTEQTLDLPPAPSDVASVSVSLSLFAAGRIVMDDIAIVEIPLF